VRNTGVGSTVPPSRLFSKCGTAGEETRAEGPSPEPMAAHSRLSGRGFLSEGGRMRRAVRYGLLPVVVLAVAAVVGLSAYSAVAPRLWALSWDLDIERAIDAAGVAPGMIVGEAGAGDGYFTLPMARRVGAEGAVYANDISQRALTSLAENARREKLPNVHTVEGTVDDPLFPRKDLELVVVVHAFHDFSRPVDWLVNLKKYLRPGGAVVIIDIDPTQGNGDSHFWPRERILGYAATAGYEKAKLVDDISKHLIIVLKPRTTTGRVRPQIVPPPAYASSQRPAAEYAAQPAAVLQPSLQP
jgi:SAM-dependent methyltransferase